MQSILHGPSLQMKGPGRAQAFHEPNHKLMDFSWLILAPVTASYLTSALLIKSTLTSSVYAVYLATSLEPGNVRQRRVEFAF